MRKLCRFGAVALCMTALLCACSKPDYDFVPEDDVQVLYAVISQGPQSKTYPGGIGEKNCNVLWSKGDKIKVFDGITSSTFEAGDPIGDGTGVNFTSKSKALDLSNELTALYPEGKWAENKGKYYFVAPNSYDYPLASTNSFLPMKATRAAGSSESLSFKSLFSCIKVTVKNITVTSISLSCDEYVAGTYILKSSSLAYSSSGSKTITLNIPGSGVVCDATSGKDFFFPVPPIVAGANLEFKINGNTAKAFSIPEGGLGAGEMIELIEIVGN